MFRLDANLRGAGIRFCDGSTRRDFLHVGALTALGLTLPGYLEARGLCSERPVQDDDVNCIMLFLVGGPSQIDTWDPKPDAPAEIRGPFKPIATTVPGISVPDLFPGTAPH